MRHERGCKDPRFSRICVPAGGSLFFPTGSPKKALPPQFSSPNEKVVYELEAGKVQRSLPAVTARAASLRGQGDPARQSSSPLPLHPWCFPSQSTRAAASCLADSVGCQFFMAEYDSTALEVYFCRHR